MWEIKYDRLRNFHISVGIGLMIAGYILYLTAAWNTYGSLDKVMQNCMLGSLNDINATNQMLQLFSECVNIKMKLMMNTWDVFHKTSMVLVIGGFLLTTFSYLHWVLEYLRPKGKKKE